MEVRVPELAPLLRQCLRIRMVEEKIIDLYPSDVIQSPVHLSIGQEAVAVGVCAALNEKDLVFPNYRGHSFYLARGGDLNAFFAELMGRQTGMSKGKAGSMHLADPEHGLMGASAVVASTISHAAGAALAEKIKPGGRPERIFVSVFGDGATEQGVFFETLNFASLHHLPVLFVLEDNSLAVHASVAERQAYSVPGVCSAFGIDYVEELAGYDPQSVLGATTKAVNLIQSNARPVLLRVKTMRYQEHVGPGEDFDSGYRSRIEVEEWKKKDPLEGAGACLEEERTAIGKEIESAVKFALSSPFSSESELLTDVF